MSIDQFIDSMGLICLYFTTMLDTCFQISPYIVTVDLEILYQRCELNANDLPFLVIIIPHSIQTQ